MKNYLDQWQTCIDKFDLELYANAKEALNRAMRHYKDKDITNYFIIIVEGYKCIAHTSDDFFPVELDNIIFPFDNERLYPLQKLITIYAFEQPY